MYWARTGPHITATISEISPSVDLPFTAFEQYMLIDDRPRWPMTFFLKVGIRGRIDRECWEQAVRDAVVCHPLLGSLLEGSEAAGYCWARATDEIPFIDWGAAEAPLDFPLGRTIDLRRQTGLRLWMRGAGDQTMIWFEFHHSCCDGLGAVQFITECLAAYHARLGVGPADSPQMVDPARLADRGRFGITPLRQILRIPQELLALLGVFEFFSHRPVSLAESGSQINAENQTAAAPLYLTHWFDAESTRRLRDKAHSRRATFNDLLLAALFAALHDWFAEHRPEAFGKVCRLMVPMNLRIAGDEAISAANIVCMINLDRRLSRKTTLRGLLRTVPLEMGIVKRLRLGLAFHHILRLAQHWRRIDRLLPTDRCLSTCLLSNLGEVFATRATKASTPRDTGELEVETVELLPPTRGFTPAAFGIVACGTKTALTLHFDPTLGQAPAQRLMELFLQRLASDTATS